MYVSELQLKPQLRRWIKAFLCNNGHYTCTIAHHHFLLKINEWPYQGASFHHRKRDINNKLCLNDKICYMASIQLNMNLPAIADLIEALMPTAKNKTIPQ